jgi:hypothetical protein
MNTAQAQVFRKVGAICAMVGGSATLIANLFHPKDLITYDSAAHLETIAADQSWTADHFVFLVAGAIILLGLLAISDVLAQMPGGFLVTLATYSAMIGTGLLAVFFAVDGYGMKAASELWLSAPPGEAAAALYAALLMSKLGIASGSIYFFWYLGLMPLLYGAAMIQSGVFPRWISIVAILGGVLGVLAGAGFYLFGYGIVSLFGFIGSQVIISLWILAAGIVLYRRTVALT